MCSGAWMDFQLETITSPDQFEKLRGEWDALLRYSPLRHVALSHEWLSTWWQSFGGRRHLMVLAVREKGQLRCAAPLMKSAVTWFGLSLRRLGTLHKVLKPLGHALS